MKSFPEGVEQLIIEETHIVKRLHLNNLFQYLLQSLNLEKGWIFSLKMLLVNPGKMALDYTGIGRMKYIAPFKMLFITTAIAFFVLKYTGSVQVFGEGLEAGAQDRKVLDLFERASEYFNILIWIYIPIAAFFSFLVNRKRTHLNYAENLVYQTYFFVLTNLIVLISMMEKIANQSAIWSWMISALLLFYNSYTYKQFFSKKWLRAIAESNLLFLFSSIIYFFILILAASFYLKYN